MTLHEYLRLPHRFRWGGRAGEDCIMFCASWVAEQTGTDPASEVRGTYRDEPGALQVLSSAGGIKALFASGLEPLGYERTRKPVSGDVGIVLAPSGIDGKIKEIGAIRFGPLWALLAPDGVRAKPLQFVAAWHLPTANRGA
ncbi:hypothetical protein QA644_08115 [Rhizobium sp. CC1099]|uniref:DUF6950 family protein n=1 Tax=Rhizobium sp. CC1099 TaxID=3039160 RepID=UPI0024B266C4|nr:hypothetical protein [Rhizobium sp. CC1099]WFU88994.1 hypothetical protein QA644_08115 [Rhizobium sp. CC1099]